MKIKHITMLLVLGAALSRCDGLPEDDAGEADAADAASDKTGGEPSDNVPKNEPKDEELNNPDLTLSRPYYRLYKSSTTDSCYFLPRPDDTAAAKAECLAGSVLGEQLAAYDFCTKVANPDVINKLPCEFGLQASTFLNKAVYFTKDGPYASEVDKAAACELAACADNPELALFCSYYQERAQKAKSGEPLTAIARLDTEVELTGIAQCLNELYGTQAL